jgi:hypothetical protein
MASYIYIDSTRLFMRVCVCACVCDFGLWPRSVVFKLFSPRTPKDTFPLNFVPQNLLVHNSGYT